MPLKRQLGHDQAQMVALGRRLRELRLQAGYGHAEVANILRVARSSYTNWENGRRCPDALALAVLSGLFAVEPGAILQAVPSGAIPQGRQDRVGTRRVKGRGRFATVEPISSTVEPGAAGAVSSRSSSRSAASLTL
jgi:transcriptional regulator with XRE-family HTH domain